MFDTLKPLLLGENANVGLSFLLGWAVTITAGLMSYPIGMSWQGSQPDRVVIFPVQTPSGDV